MTDPKFQLNTTRMCISEELEHVPSPSITPPDSFSFQQVGDARVVKFRYTNLLSTVIFLAVWLVLWGCTCAFLFTQGFASGSFFSRVLIAGFVIGWFAGLYGVVYFPNVRKTFRFESNALESTTQLFGMTSVTTYHRSRLSWIYVARPRRRNTTGDKNWSVVLEIQREKAFLRFIPTRRVTLLSALTQVEGEWLASIVANWSEVDIKYQVGRAELSDAPESGPVVIPIVDL